ncbi:MAG: dienelactone hydrolase family protein [Actinomycetota bacterium]|nr:dienelactone hydrolase family protein [Actinomycetota bacterium]
MGQTIDLAAAARVAGSSPGLTAYAVRPPGSGRVPGVVVVHEAFGLQDVTRRQAEHLASLGYAVVAPDLFSDGGAMRCLRTTMRSMRTGRGRAYQDIAAARQWLLDQDDSNGAVGIIGFCMGGGFALATAAGHGFDASSVNYGMLPSTPDVLEGACPIVASYGGRDASLAGAAGKLEHHLTRLGVAHDVKEYPEAGHSFLNDEQSVPWYLAPVLRVAGFGPQPEAAADAWGRIARFFSQHLAR